MLAATVAHVAQHKGMRMITSRTRASRHSGFGQLQGRRFEGECTALAALVLFLVVFTVAVDYAVVRLVSSTFSVPNSYATIVYL